ncbi:hypothetical protein BKA70DRAFT_1422033 [Coprinopsis sp. MPI-PUGE-AT-0042]|nr:hypothetical protein BKA70DRAFT_1422033 [Coprinopsis sp. MPI-PUGE-AT-0042]
MPANDRRNQSQTAAAGPSSSAVARTSSGAGSRGMDPPPAKRPKLMSNSRGRDYAAGAATFVAENDMEKLLRELDTDCFKPILGATQRKLNEAKKAAIATLAAMEEISEKEIETKYWASRARPPALPLAKVLVRAGCDDGGPWIQDPRSNQGVVRGHCEKLGQQPSIIGACCALAPSSGTKGRWPRLLAYIEIMSRQEGVLHTSRREKYTATEEDVLAILNTFLNGDTAISTGTMRVQLLAVTQIIDTTGQRPGAIVEGDDYLGTNQCLTWGDLTIMFQFMKYMRGVEGADLRLYLRSTRPENISKDATLPLITLGIERGVFDVDVWKLFDPATFPALPAGKHYPLTIKPEKVNEAVFRNVADNGGMSLSSLNHYYSKAAKANGFAAFSPYVLRPPPSAYFWSRRGKHDPRKGLPGPASAGFDLTAAHTDEQAELSIGHLKNSIGFKTHLFNDSEERKELLHSEFLAPFCPREIRVQEVIVIKVYGKSSRDLGPEYSGDPLVNWARFHSVPSSFDPPHLPWPPPTLEAVHLMEKWNGLQSWPSLLSQANPDRLSASSCGNLFAEFARDHPTDTRKAFVLFLASFIARDRVIKAGKCPSCHSRGEENTAKAVANLEHWIPCELKSRPNCEFCPFCSTFLTVSVLETDMEADQAGSVSDMNASLRMCADEHYENCVELFLDDRRQMGSASIPEDEGHGGADNKDGSRERAAFRRNFGLVKHIFRTESWKERCTYYMNVSKLAEHFRSHFYVDKPEFHLRNRP